VLRKLSPTGSCTSLHHAEHSFLDIYLRDKLTVVSRLVLARHSSEVQAKRFYGSLYEPSCMR